MRVEAASFSNGHTAIGTGLLASQDPAREHHISLQNPRNPDISPKP